MMTIYNILSDPIARLNIYVIARLALPYINRLILALLLAQSLFFSTLIFAEAPANIQMGEQRHQSSVVGACSLLLTNSLESFCALVKSGFADPRKRPARAMGFDPEEGYRTYERKHQRSFHGQSSFPSYSNYYKLMCDEQKLNDGELG